MHRLTITHENDTRYFAIPPGIYMMGAGPDNDLVVPFPGISRHHARLETGIEGSIHLVDLDSKNGLRVDGERLASIELRPGLMVELGRARLALEEVSTSDLEVALPIDSSAKLEERTGKTPDTGTWHSQEAKSDTVRALQLVREIEHLSPDDRHRELVAILEKSVELVGARTLLVVKIRGSELSLTAFAGVLPSDGLWQRLEARVGGPQGRQRVIAVLDEEDRELGAFLPPASGEELRLIALFPSQHAALSAWRQDFLAYLVHSLG